jgi:hypothetical protein
MTAPSITRSIRDIDRVDTVLTGARVWTGDLAGTWADSLAITDGRLVAVGPAPRSSISAARWLSRG